MKIVIKETKQYFFNGKPVELLSNSELIKIVKDQADEIKSLENKIPQLTTGQYTYHTPYETRGFDDKKMALSCSI